MVRQENAKRKDDGDDVDNSNTEPKVLEQGDIYFFYRPKKKSQDVKDIDDIRRFFMVTAPENKYNLIEGEGKGDKNKRQFYRLFVIGKKSLPEIRKSEARASERYWARVGGVFEDKDKLTKDLFSDEFREGDAARPAGMGKYVIVEHQKHAEIAYILGAPDEPGEAQKELGIEKEARYIISVINPKTPTPPGYPSAEESPKYPDKVLKKFKDNENFVSLSNDTEFINYLNAQIILIGAGEGKDTIYKDLGISIDEEKGTNGDIFKKLDIKKGQISTKPLTEGKLE